MIVPFLCRFNLADKNPDVKKVEPTILKSWKEKDLETCMNGDDPECNFGHQTEFYVPGFVDPIEDLSIVMKLLKLFVC